MPNVLLHHPFPSWTRAEESLSRKSVLLGETLVQGLLHGVLRTFRKQEVTEESALPWRMTVSLCIA